MIKKVFYASVLSFGILATGQAQAALTLTSSDIITIDGKDWAQPVLFSNLSWNDVNAVCLGGICGPTLLNGYDVSGWTWATVTDIDVLFN